MTHSSYSSWGGYSTTTSTDRVDNAFRSHFYALFSQKSVALTTISKWRSELIDQIERHAEFQKILLEQIYITQYEHLGRERELYYQAYYSRETRNNDGQINQLLDQCKALKVELVNLNFTLRDTDFIEITPFDAPKEQRESNINADKNDDSALRTKATTDEASEPTNSQHTPPVVTPKASSSSTNPIEYIHPMVDAFTLHSTSHFTFQSTPNGKRH